MKMKMHTSCLGLVLFTFFLFILSSFVFADVFQWVGSDIQRNGLFSNPVCWYPETVPYHGDTAYFNQPQTFSVWFDGSKETWNMEIHAGDITFMPDVIPLFRDYLLNHATIKGGTLRVRSMQLSANDFLDVWGLEVHHPTLVIEANGSVVCANMKLGGGNYNLSEGILNIAGPNASLKVSNSLIAGHQGSGEIVITQGSLTAVNCIIGDDDWGEINVQNSGSLFSGQNVTVGAGWSGSLKILDGAAGIAINCDLGISPNPPEYPDSSGSLRVDGSGSKFSAEQINLGGSFAGAGGFGRIFIDHGGLLDVAQKIKVWTTPVVTASKNRIELTNGTLIADEIELGTDTEFMGGSQSVLRINRITEPSTLELSRLEAGHSKGSASTIHSMQIAGNWTMHDGLIAGLDSDMSLQIIGNGQVSSLYGKIGSETGSNGLVLVSGPSARWNNTSHLYVGDSGSGSLTIQNGANVSDVFGYIGHHTNSSGTVTVDGLNSRWQNTYIFIGDVAGSEGGTGSLSIQNSGQVDTLYNILVGSGGTLTVNGAILRADEVEMTGSGLLNIQGTNALYLNALEVPTPSYVNLRNSALYVGHGSGAGRFSIRAGQSMEMEGVLNVGWDTPAEFMVSDGGLLATTNSGYCYIGQAGGGSGTVTLTGTGSSWTSSGSIGVGTNSENGSLSILNEASLSVADVLNIYGKVNINNGLLKAHHVICQPSSVFQSVDSTLQIALINGNLQQDQGLLDVDWNGLMEITGNLTMNGSITQIEIGGTNPYSGHDVLKIGGLVHWSGTLEILPKEAFIPCAGQVFRILDFNLASQSGWFDEILLPELPLPLVWSVDRLYSQGELSISAEAFAIGWGKNTVGQTVIPRFTGIKDIAVGWTHGLMLDQEGFIWHWGFNPFGVVAPAYSDYIAIDAGGYFSLGLRQTNGTLVAWGDNREGQCNVPVGSYKAMAAGWSHSVAIRTDGSLAGWGTNLYGEINVPTGNNYKAVAAGQNFSVALRTDGSLTAWGIGTGGQLNVPAGNDYIAIDAGVYHGLALKANGSIVAWGSDTYGQVSQIPSGNDFIEIAAGSYHNLARRLDASITAWGKNDSGQTFCPQGNDVITIAAGDDFSVMLTMEPPMPVLYGPAEGEVLTAGMPYEIQWKTWHPVQDMDIYYSVDNGQTFSPIEPQNNGNTNSYLWLVPQSTSLNCYLKISERLNPDVYALSGRFEIRPPIYVDGDAQGANNGTSWTDAFVSLQDALAFANANDVVWVASASQSYLPDIGQGLTKGDRNLSFNLESDVKLYGGFPPAGGAWSQRNPLSCITMLSGDLNRDDQPAFINYADNSIRIVSASNVNKEARLDGFVIRGANGTSGGGLRNLTSSPVIAFCVFEENYVSSTGAGIHNINDSHPDIQDCIFRSNRANDSGGGITNSSECYCMIKNCAFENNWAKWGGGGIYNYNAAAVIEDCQFKQNSCDAWGGGVHNTQSHSAAAIKQCMFIGNFSKDGGAIYNRVDAAPVITSCTFVDNRATTGIGGAIFANHSSIKIDRCGFYSNQAGDDAGGVYANDYSNVVLTNSLFSGNHSPDKAGAVYIRSNSQAKIHHTTLYGNEALYGGGLYVWGNVNNLELVNSIVWNNMATYGSQLGHGNNSFLSVRWTCLEGSEMAILGDGTGGYYTESIISQNPALNDPDGFDDLTGTIDDDCRLASGSVCIDAGNKNMILPLPWEDLGGKFRLIDGNCDGTLQTDMGAYEFAPVEFGSLDGDCDVDIADLTLFIEQWLSEGESLSADIAPLFGDSRVNLEDFSIMAKYWLNDYEGSIE